MPKILTYLCIYQCLNTPKLKQPQSLPVFISSSPFFLLQKMKFSCWYKSRTNTIGTCLRVSSCLQLFSCCMLAKAKLNYSPLKTKVLRKKTEDDKHNCTWVRIVWNRSLTAEALQLVVMKELCSQTDSAKPQLCSSLWLNVWVLQLKVWHELK